MCSSQFLSLAEFWYNTSFHSAIKMSPFMALYGHEPRHWGIDDSFTCTAPSLEDGLSDRKKMQHLLLHNLNHARQYMKNQADKKRIERTFSLGEEVFVKLQPYVQSSVNRRINHKLSFRYFGPYKITKGINPVAYEVGLPPDSRIHPVFHVSQLREVLKTGMTASVSLPVISDVPAVPVKIIGHRWRQSPTGRREQVQVQWPPDSSMDITWEDKLELLQQFPDIAAWGQAVTQEGGDVSSSTARGDDEEGLGLARRPARPKRLVQPNRRQVGPEWTN